MTEKAKKKSKSRQKFSDEKRIILASTSALIGVAIFATSYIGMKQTVGLGRLNQLLLSWTVSHRNGFLTEIAKIITSIANPLPFAFLVCALVVVWAILKREIWRPTVLVGSIAVAAGTSALLKIVFMNARPPQIDMIPAFEYDFSFPSGHTIGMAVFLLVMGYLIYSRAFSSVKFWGWMAIAAIGTILVALSRLYLGYHWLTDVTASVGLAFLILAIVVIIDFAYVKRVKT
jgi:undecaprenyl-diphosphatase